LPSPLKSDTELQRYKIRYLESSNSQSNVRFLKLKKQLFCINLT
jgi:hypothetical protein